MTDSEALAYLTALLVEGPVLLLPVRHDGAVLHAAHWDERPVEIIPLNTVKPGGESIAQACERHSKLHSPAGKPLPDTGEVDRLFDKMDNMAVCDQPCHDPLACLRRGCQRLEAIDGKRVGE